MKIIHAAASPWRFALRRPVATAFGTLHHREGLRVRLLDDAGRVGRGESAPLPGFGTEGLAEACRALEAALPALKEIDPEAPTATLEIEGAALAGAPTARAALDSALHELVARAAGLSVASWLARRAGHQARTRVAVSRLLVADALADLESEVRDAVAAGFTTLKLKVGRPDDNPRVALARAVAGPEVSLAVDANGAWAPDEALAHLEVLARHTLAWVEQPVVAADLAGLAYVRRRSPVPVAADEALLPAGAAQRVLAEGAADRLVLKPAALGGLARAGEIAAAARRDGVPVSVTSLLDGALGIHAALHFAAALPEPPFACGLATGDLLHGDPLRPPRLQRGALELAPGPGLGGLEPEDGLR